MKRGLVTIVLAAFCLAAAAAGIGPAKDSDPEMRPEDVVVYAEVASVAKTKVYRYRVTFVVKSVIAGRYDAAASPVATADMGIDDLGLLPPGGRVYRGAEGEVARDRGA